MACSAARRRKGRPRLCPPPLHTRAPLLPLLHLPPCPTLPSCLPAVNTPEWCLVDAACHAYSLVSVPLYDTLGPDTVKYICNHAELAAVACSLEVLGKLLEVLHECPTVRLLVRRGARGAGGAGGARGGCVCTRGKAGRGGAARGWIPARPRACVLKKRSGRGRVSSGAPPHPTHPDTFPACALPPRPPQIVYGTRPHQRLPDVPAAPHCKIMTLDRVRALGYKHPRPHHPPKPSDVALINYTSGTTGVPKGAVLTHSSIIANAGAARGVGRRSAGAAQPPSRPRRGGAPAWFLPASPDASPGVAFMRVLPACPTCPQLARRSC